MKMTAKLLMAAAFAAGLMPVADAADKVEIDMDAVPIKDVRTSTCGPEIGYAGCWLKGAPETYWLVTNRVETARAMKGAGAWFQRMWNANAWFANPNSDPGAAFRFWKENGIKLLFTLEAWSGEKAKREIISLVDYVVTNGYQDVVAGFELGNESFYAKREAIEKVCETWNEVIPEIKRRMPDVHLGLPVAELFERNPDIEQVRKRMLASGEIKRDGYFSASRHNQASVLMIQRLSNNLDKVSHLIYHAYGAESPYSCSYYGFERFRNFAEAFPQVKGKRLWLTEVRPRSDEDNRCQRMFRESLIMAHYSLMAICQPELDGFNHHQLTSLSGGLYVSNGRFWQTQWRDAGKEYADAGAPFGLPHLEVGPMGAVYRVLAGGVLEHPLILCHGTLGATNEVDAFRASSRVCDQVYARRRALKEGKRGGEVPQVTGEVEWTALANAKRDELCLLMVNTRNEPAAVTLTVAGKEFAAPTYRTVSCPERYLDCADVPGEGRPWRQLSWEETQSGYSTVQMEKYKGLVPSAETMDVTIEPHTVQSVTVLVRDSRVLQRVCQALCDEAVASGEQGAVQFCAYKNGKCIVDVCAGRLSTNENAAAVRPDSLFPIFSTEKPLLATAVHRAVEKGKMSYDKPLCTWWPELTGKGKERLTLRETLGYRTGLNGGRPKCYTNDIEYCDWERTWRAAAAEDPEIEPGTKQRYLPRAYAWMLGHPLEVAMGKPASRVLEEEILRPAGIAKEFYFIADDSVFPRIATVYCSKYTAPMNEAWARHAFLPSSFAVASARAVAKFYNRLCGFDGKKPLIRKETLDAALKPCRHPDDPLPDAETMKREWFMIFGMGYGLWGEAGRMDRVFGHGGAGGSEGLVDRDNRLVVGFTCNFSRNPNCLRQRLYDAVGMTWRYSRDKKADIQTLQMNTKDRK